jgi:hypothetical protein
MKRFFTLSFFLFSFVLFGQNLIPDGSAEDVDECPSSFGNIDGYTSSWQSFRFLAVFQGKPRLLA